MAQTNPYIKSTNGVLDNEHLEATYFIYVAPFKPTEEIPLHNQVIGESSGYPITPEFLKEMNDYWFN